MMNSKMPLGTKVYAAILCLFVSTTSLGQIIGTTTPCVGVNVDYVFNNGVQGLSSWLITNGSIVTSWSGGANYYVTVQWSAGAGILSFKRKVVIATLNVNASGPAGPTGGFTYASSCYSHQYTETTTITRTNTPPGGTTWYWQTSATGTSTSIGSGASIVANAGETYYLRANSGSCWAPGALAAATIPQPPNYTPTGTACYNQSVQLTASAPGGLVIRWYDSCTGGTLLGTGPTFTTPALTQSTPYRVSAYDASTGAESPRKIIHASIVGPTTPPIATAATSVSNYGFTANWTGTSSGLFDVATDVNFTAGSILAAYNGLSVTGSSKVVTGLNSGITYYYRIRATGATCTSANSNTISVITVAVPPVAKAATLVTSTSFQANWEPTSGATSYLLDVAYNAGFTSYLYEGLSVPGVSQSVTVTGSQSSYYYRVRAVYAGGATGNSNTITTANITGPSSACMNASTDYSFYNGTTYTGQTWEITNGVIESSSAVGNVYYVTLHWTSSPGTLKFKWHGSLVIATISVTPLNPTPTGSFTYASSCYSHNSTEATTITRTDSPPPGTTWYWQTSPNGESTSIGSGASIVANPGETYFLRGFSSCWSASSTALATATIPQVPVNLFGGTSCKDTPVSMSALASGGLTVRWYDNCQGGSVLATGPTYTTPPLSSTKGYYVVAYDASTGAESPRKRINATISGPSGNPLATAATNVTESSFTANWTGTNVSILDVSTTDTTFMGTLVPNYAGLYVFGNSKNVTGLKSGTTYHYRIRQYYAGPQLTCLSPYSDTITVILVPKAPLCLPATEQTYTSFRANWNPSVGASTYYLDVSTDINFGSFVGSFHDYPVTGTSTVISNLVGEETKFYYRVRAANASGTSGFYYTQAVVIRDQNYVRSQEVSIRNVKADSVVEALPVGKKSEAFNFFDGLGRPIQELSVKQSPSSKDVVQPVVYDEFGREPVKYLPFTSGNDGWFKSGFRPRESPEYEQSTNPQYEFYQSTSKVAVDAKPYAETIFEAGPLNRVRKIGAAGAAWQPISDPSNYNDKTVKLKDETNAAGEILLLSYNPATGVLTSGQGTATHYRAGSLSIMRTTDEHNNEVLEYKDNSGKVVCKFIQFSSSGPKMYAKTYYLYDDFGNLVLVLQPEAIRMIEGTN